MKVKSNFSDLGKVIGIVGFMGCGKTNLLERLNVLDLATQRNTSHRKNLEVRPWQGLDMDQYLLNRSPYQSISAWVEKEGWESFRREEKAFLNSLADKKFGNVDEFSYIIALGGGALNEETLKIFKNAPHMFLTWINIPFQLCYDRIKNEQEGPQARPLARKSKLELKELYERRLPFYQESDLILSMNDLDNIETPMDLWELIEFKYQQK